MRGRLLGPSKLNADSEGDANADRKGASRLFTFAAISCLTVPLYYANLLLPRTTYDPWVIVCSLIGETIACSTLVSAFRNLAERDRQTFRNPYVLSFFMVFGFPLVLTAYLILFATTSSPVSTNTGAMIHQLAYALVGVAAIVIGIVVVFVGALGAAQGLWRVGERYNSNALKLGSVLLVIPYVNTLSVLLLLFGTAKVRRQLQNPS